MYMYYMYTYYDKKKTDLKYEILMNEVQMYYIE